MARAAGKADQSVAQLLQQRLVERGLTGRLALASRRPGVRMRSRDQPAQVRVPGRILDEQRHVRAVGEGDLRAGDRANAEVFRRMRELERAVETVMVGERERVIAELRGAHRELLRQRRTVEERVRRVRVQLDVSSLRASRRAR